MLIAQEFGSLAQTGILDKVAWGLAGQFLHLAVQMHTTQSDLVGNKLHTQFGIRQVLVHHLHDAVHQSFVGRLQLDVIHLVGLFGTAVELTLHAVAVGEHRHHHLLEHVDVEGFRQIPVGTHIQSFQTVLVGAKGSKQKHGDITGIDVFLDVLTELYAVHYRHHHIADHHIHLAHILQDIVPSLLTIDKVADIHRMRQLTHHILTDRLVVLHHDHIETAWSRRFLHFKHYRHMVVHDILA